MSEAGRFKTQSGLLDAVERLNATIERQAAKLEAAEAALASEREENADESTRLHTSLEAAVKVNGRLEAQVQKLRVALEAARPILEAEAAREDEQHDYETELALHDGSGNPGLVPRPAVNALRLLDLTEEGKTE